MISDERLLGRIDVIKLLLEGFEGEHPIEISDFKRWLQELLDEAEEALTSE